MFDTAEKRFSAIHLTKRSGLPVPTNSTNANKRLHMIGTFSCIAPSTVIFYFWRNKNLLSTLWTPKAAPLDGSTQTL